MIDVMLMLPLAAAAARSLSYDMFFRRENRQTDGWNKFYPIRLSVVDPC